MLKLPPDPVDVHVGGLMRQRRREMGMSQTELGDALGVTFQQVQKYENGANRISASTLFRAAKVQGVHPGTYFDGFGNLDELGWSDEAREIRDWFSSKEAFLFAQAIVQIPDVSRGALLQFVKNLVPKRRGLRP